MVIKTQLLKTRCFDLDRNVWFLTVVFLFYFSVKFEDGLSLFNNSNNIKNNSNNNNNDNKNNLNHPHRKTEIKG